MNPKIDSDPETPKPCLTEVVVKISVPDKDMLLPIYTNCVQEVSLLQDLLRLVLAVCILLCQRDSTAATATPNNGGRAFSI